AACTKSENKPENGGQESGASVDQSDLPYYSQGIDENGLWLGVTAKDYVKLGQYSGVEISAKDIEPTDDDIDSALQSKLSAYEETVEITDRAAELWDTVSIDFAGYMDGVQFDGGTGTKDDLTLGSGAFIDGFEDGIVGHTPGEEFDLDLTFPDPYQNNPDLAGKPVTFHVKLNYIKGTKTPQLTDAFVKENFGEEGVTTVDGLREATIQELRDEAVYAILSEKVESFEVSEVPESMVKYQEESMRQYYQMYADMYGMELEDFVSGMGGAASMDELIDTYHDELVDTARIYLIYQAIAEDAGLSITDEDIEAEFADTDADTYKQIVEYYGLNYIKCMLLNSKVGQYLVENAKFVD
ncbi:MAG: trigger factor, partial [Clostridia bacterium]|nr:trigger factor [Clostridia bacterium]